MRTVKLALIHSFLLLGPVAGYAAGVSSHTVSEFSGLEELFTTPIGISLGEFLKVRPGAGPGGFDLDKLGPVDASLPDQVLMEKAAYKHFRLAIYNFVEGKLSHIAVTGRFPKKTIGETKKELLRLCDSLWGEKRFFGAYESTRKGRTKRYASYRWDLGERHGKLTFDASAPDMGIGITMIIIKDSALRQNIVETDEKRLKGKAERKVLRDVGFENSR